MQEIEDTKTDLNRSVGIGYRGRLTKMIGRRSARTIQTNGFIFLNNSNFMKKTMQRERKHCLGKMRNCDGLGLVKKQTIRTRKPAE